MDYLSLFLQSHFARNCFKSISYSAKLRKKLAINLNNAWWKSNAIHNRVKLFAGQTRLCCINSKKQRAFLLPLALFFSAMQCISEPSFLFSSTSWFNSKLCPSSRVSRPSNLSPISPLLHTFWWFSTAALGGTMSMAFFSFKAVLNSSTLYLSPRMCPSTLSRLSSTPWNKIIL